MAESAGLLTPLRGEGVYLGPADDVELPAVRHDGRERAVGPRPQLLARARVEAVGAAAERREVDDTADHGRRSGDRPVRVELPEDGARRSVEGVERLVVRADEDPVVPYGRRSVDVAAGAVRPAQLP